ncbi:MAG: carbohydrate ABC transporter permease [Clostridiales bacterium]|jgi:ABC-type glycerol-3-phosphate transport system permease component|nr:carbohydrate ABC transporter permease [Clostridiales bacterium]
MKKKLHLKLKKRRPNRSRGGDILIYSILIIFGVFMGFPLVYAINSAFKPLDEIFVYPPRLFVQNPTTDNFQDLVVILGQSWVPFTRYLFNTLFITVVGTAGHIVVSSMGAFVLAKFDFPGGRTFFNIVTTALMFNAYVTAIPNYLIMARLHWVDTVWAIVVPAIAAPMGLFLMKQYMESIPDALIDAATIDGANLWKTFTKIVMPTVKPAWLTLMIMSIQSLWNNPASTYIYSEELKTLPYAMQQIAGGGIARAGVGSAVALVMMIVPITAFIILQSNVMETMASSGIKE